MRRATNTAIRGSDPNRVLSRENEDLVVGIAPHKAVYTCEKCGNDVVVPLHPEAAAPPTWNCPCGGIAEYVGDREIGEELKSFAPASSSKPPKTHIDHVRCATARSACPACPPAAGCGRRRSATTTAASTSWSPT